LDVRLRHTLRISGRAVVLATAINAVGFAGLATSSFPPLRQFGVMTAGAFVLALVADLTVLPAALWLASRSGHTAGRRETASGSVPGMRRESEHSHGDGGNAALKIGLASRSPVDRPDP
jgi:predicted RND superfamily exporter protein